MKNAHAASGNLQDNKELNRSGGPCRFFEFKVVRCHLVNLVVIRLERLRHETHSRFDSIIVAKRNEKRTFGFFRRVECRKSFWCRKQASDRWLETSRPTMMDLAKSGKSGLRNFWPRPRYNAGIFNADRWNSVRAHCVQYRNPRFLTLYTNKSKPVGGISCVCIFPQ